MGSSWLGTALLVACGACIGSNPSGSNYTAPSHLQLRFIETPRGAVVGSEFEVDVQVIDARVLPYSGAVELQLIAPGSPAQLGGSLVARAQQGRAVFTRVSVDSPATAALLRATADGASATSAPFDVAAPPVTIAETPMGGDPAHGWQHIGFSGGAITAVASTPGVSGEVFAATPRGIFSSHDAAQTWSRCAMAGAPAEAADSILPVSQTELWADFGGYGVWLSRDECATWTERNDGFNAGGSFVGYDWHRLALRGHDVVAFSLYQTFRFDRLTNQWQPLDPFGLDAMIGFAIAPSDPSIAYAVDGTQRLYASSDGGASWQPRAAVEAKVWLPVVAIAVHPENPEVALVVDGRIYRTEDGGNTLTAVADFNVVRALFDPVDGDIAWATLSSGGLLRSTDAGRTWAPANDGLPFFGLSPSTLGNWSSSLAIDGADPSQLYAGFTDGRHGGGVYRSHDAGASWQRASDGLEADGVTALAADAASATIYAGTGRGLYASSDEGATWQFLASLPLVQSLSVDPFDARALVAGTVGGILHSSDGGATWRPSVVPWPVFSGAVWHDPARPGVVLAASEGIYRSTDGGQSFSFDHGEGIFHGFAADVAHSLTVASADGTMEERGGFFVSADGGSSWNRTGAAAGDVLASAGALYLLHAFAGPLQRSTDAGATWTPVLTEPDLLRFAVAGETLFAARTAVCQQAPGCIRAGGKVLRSDDGGASWSQTQGALPLEMMGPLWVSPRDPSVVLVGTLDGGLYRSIDGGR